ncbi:MAG TPA: hypothetical protein PLD82_05350 [Spirochaetota bacterium]|nr:hypothetical protein [Spirochaetota bacterium]HPH04064.1 hypothetical protein [Spirochaetota bacterium]
MRPLIRPLILAGLLTAGSLHANPVYRLTLSQSPWSAAWQRHSLVFESADALHCEAVLSLDLGIGPQARMPFDWERVHQVRLRGGLDQESGHFQLQGRFQAGQQTQTILIDAYLLTTHANGRVIVGRYRLGSRAWHGLYGTLE